METSIFLAKLLGPMFIIVAVGILFNLKYYQRVIEDFFRNAALLYLGGIFALGFGLLLVLFHNIWMANWALIITILGWLSIIKGVCLIVCPNVMLKMSGLWQKNTAVLVVHLVIGFALGAILTIMGYFA